MTKRTKATSEAASELVPSLVASIRAGDVDAILARAATLDDDERARAAPSILKAFDAAHGLVFSRDPSKAYKRLGLAEPEGDDRQNKYDILHAAQIALLATLQDVEQVRKYAWRSIPEPDHVMRVLASRDRSWNLAWVALLCEIAPTRWHTARALVRAGFSARPETDGYVLGMIWAAALDPGRVPARGVEARAKRLFEEEPELLDDDVWRVFEVEGNRDISLTGCQRFWHASLLEWANTGRLDRARMLDATLAALARDFPQHKAGFYSRLHDDLAPTAAEIAARAATYIDLLASRISPTVSLATRALNALGDGVDTGALARAATSAGRSARGQSTALTLLRLLTKPRDPEALLAVTAFLEHESVDVVDAALATLESCAVTPDLIARVAAVAPAIAASRRAQVNAWLATHGAAEVTPAAPALVPPRRTEPPREVSASARARAKLDELTQTAPDAPWPRVTLDDPAPRLDPALAIAPIASTEELFEVLARALEEPNDRVSFERMLDGVSRLGAPRDALATDRTKPLAKRAATLVGRGGAGAAPTLVHAWLTGKDAHRSSWASTERFGDRRVANVIDRLRRGETRPLLALPSTSNFFLDPRVLVARVRAQGAAAIDVEDAVTALLRLAPEHHEEALADLTDEKGPLAAALRHALGGTATPDAEHPALWIAAARVRAPGRDDPRVLAAFPHAGPDAGAAATISYAWNRVESSDGKSSWARFTVTMTPEAAPVAEHFSVLLATKGHAGNGAQFGVEPGVREIASVWPGDRRTFFAWGTDRITHNVDWSSAEWANHVFLEPLLDPDVPLDEHGLMLLAIALNTKEARENALATDALIQAITDGRVVGPELAAPLAFHWHPVHEDVTYSHRATASRWAKTFANVARASVLHAEIVRRILEAFFAVPPAVPPPDVHALLQLWLDLATEAKTGVPEAARAAVERIGKSGKAKAIATRLLALAPGPSAHAAEAHALAMEGRWQRAARWAHRS